MDDHKRRYVTCSAPEDDIISNLPELLSDEILERLPIEDAVRTSVLSKKWRYRWTTMRALVLGLQFSKKFLSLGALAHNGFIRVVNQIMIHLEGPIFKFHFIIPNIDLDSFQEVHQWMRILSRNGVRELFIGNYNRLIYQIPSSVFSCLELRQLGLYKCIFKPPLEFQGFPNLQLIYLWRVNFVRNLGGTLINLPQLKTLTLDECDNVNKFNIKAEKLQDVKVVKCHDAMLLRLLHSKHLRVVHICFLGNLQDSLRVERFNLATMLSKLPNVVSFTIDGYFLKFLAAENFPKYAVKCLKKLEFQSFSFGDLDQVQGALCLLRNSPNLKKLWVTHMQMGSEADLELTSNYLESPDCLLQTMFMLQTVEMKSLEGSRPELLFVKLLLDQSPCLDKMIIRPSATADAEKRLNIAKEVMLFPRASTKAKMVYLDPKP